MNDKLTSYPAHIALADFRTNHRGDGVERVFELDPIELIREFNALLAAQQRSEAIIRELVEALERTKVKFADLDKLFDGYGIVAETAWHSNKAINRANQLLQGEE